MAKTSLPMWIRVVSSLISALGLFVGASIYLSPATFMPHIDFAANGADYLSQMWAARQVAIAGLMAWSCLRASPKGLQTTLAIYCVMNIQDAAIGARIGDTGLLVGASFFGALTGLMAWRLRD